MAEINVCKSVKAEVNVCKSVKTSSKIVYNMAVAILI